LRFSRGLGFCLRCLLRILLRFSGGLLRFGNFRRYLFAGKPKNAFSRGAKNIG
jgi:hypothetical protein